MEAVLPIYEHAVTSAFYNGCVVASVQAVCALLPAKRRVVVVEVGAGTGGTTSSVLPILGALCERYIFTDVSDVFLRNARVRYTDFPFVEYSLLNIDADLCLQGFASHQVDLLISTNVLHATPYMNNTLRNCKQLLRAGGMIIVNEGLVTSAFTQITFGMTDGWWLFAESCDQERVGQDSPLLSWRQWQAVLICHGFHHAHCMQGDTFLRSQAVIVGQKAASGNGEPVALSDSAHFFSGGLGGLGLLTARLLVEGGAQQLVLSSRSDRVIAGSESDWARLAQCSAYVRRVRCDASDVACVRAVVRTLRGESVHLRGVFHAAHMLADAVVANQNALNFRVTYGPKVHGASALHATSWCTPLVCFNVYSSVAGLMGAAGQMPHSAANAWLDAMTGWRHQRGVRAQCVNWAAVSGVSQKMSAHCGAYRLSLLRTHWPLLSSAGLCWPLLLRLNVAELPMAE
ncbi:KR domain-containing protein [bacterium]|nr:KR domain-containing protein [bacterium]